MSRFNFLGIQSTRGNRFALAQSKSLLRFFCFMIATMLVACAVNSTNTATLEKTYWKLLALRGKPVEASADQREPHLVLQTKQQRLTGSGGCNQLMGSYTVHDDHLSFGRTASTMMACPQGMEQERAFLDALAATARWRIDGQRMRLLNGSDETLAEFESRDMP